MRQYHHRYECVTTPVSAYTNLNIFKWSDVDFLLTEFAPRSPSVHCSDVLGRGLGLRCPRSSNVLRLPREASTSNCIAMEWLQMSKDVARRQCSKEISLFLVLARLPQAAVLAGSALGSSTPYSGPEACHIDRRSAATFDYWARA